MAASKFKLFPLILLVLAVLVLILGYWFYNKAFNKSVSGMHAIPHNTLLFLQANHPEPTLSQLLSDNELWNTLKGIAEIKQIHDQLKLLDTTIKLNQDIAELLSEAKIYIAVNSLPNDSLGVVYYVQTPTANMKTCLINCMFDLCGEGCTLINNVNKAYKINQLDPGGNGPAFYFTYTKGIFIGSKRQELVIASVDQLHNKQSISTLPAYKKVSQTAGKYVDAHLYINMDRFYSLLTNTCRPGHHRNISLLKNLASWCELDINLKHDELLLNGYTEASDSSNQYLDIFRGQTPQTVKMTRILPYNTNLLLWFGVENFKDYYHQFEEYLSMNKRFETHYNNISLLNNRYKINIENELLGWIGHEFAFVSLGTSTKDYKDKAYAVFQTDNPVRANQLLTRIMHNIRGSSIVKTYNNYLIKKINLPDLLPLVFGPAFSLVPGLYFTIIEDYVVFGNTTQALEEFINTFLSGKMLSDNVNYTDFSDNIAEQTNVYLYFNSRNALPALNHYLSGKMGAALTRNSSLLGNFHAFALQFSYINQMFYTNAYLKYNPGYREENRSLWQVALDSKIISRPYFVKDHTDKTFNIIVFDEDNQMYLIDNNGNILWKKALQGRILSQVYPVDFYKNRKIQYLFNTADHIYLVDLLSRNVANYPIQLGRKSTNGLGVFDYINNKDYRIVFACEDNRVYNYNIKGNAVRGWNKPRVETPVKQRVQHLVASNKDYIIIPQTDGKVHITDRRGNTRIRIRDPFVNGMNSGFYTNKTNSKGVMITTDNQGRLTYIKTNGRLDRTDFGDFSPEHYFLYEDIDKNGSNDFIFLDGKTLQVFDRFKNILFEHEFDHHIHIKPQVIPISYRESLLGVVDAENNTLHLFDHKGQPRFGAGMAGDTPFYIGSLNNDSNLNLVIGSGKTLYNYLLK